MAALALAVSCLLSRVAAYMEECKSYKVSNVSKSSWPWSGSGSPYIVCWLRQIHRVECLIQSRLPFA